jgi:hypothetical protein
MVATTSLIDAKTDVVIRNIALGGKRNSLADGRVASINIEDTSKCWGSMRERSASTRAGPSRHARIPGSP